MVYNKPKNMEKIKANPSSRVTLRIPQSLSRKIQWVAAKSNLSLNQTVQNLLIQALSQPNSALIQATKQSPDSETDD